MKTQKIYSIFNECSSSSKRAVCIDRAKKVCKVLETLIKHGENIDQSLKH